MFQKLADRQRAGDKKCWMEMVANLKLGLFHQRLEYVLVVKIADHFIELAFVDGYAGKSAFDNAPGDFLERRVKFDGVYLGARDHHRLDRRVGKFEDAVDQLFFGLIENPFSGALANQRLYFLC